MKRHLARLALASATSLAALVPLGAHAVEIEWLQWFAAEDTSGFYDELVADFEAEHPDITVKLVTQPFGKVRESIVTDNAIGVGSDVLGLNMPWDARVPRYRHPRTAGRLPRARGQQL